jgi:dimethylamine--corrinoid protein Co-methyltransferase
VGIGDAVGMHSAHVHAAGMGGMRAAGDLVARMQMTRGMRLTEAKEHVAGKLGVGVSDLSDPYVMTDLRGELGLGRVPEHDTFRVEEPTAIEAKFHIAELLDVSVNSVARFKEHTAGGWRRT